MQLRQFIILFGILLLSFSLVLAESVDDNGNPNDPTVNEDANACFSKGSMDGKCDTEWEWICGWYLIRFEYELLSREVFPNACSSLLPEEVILEDAEPASESNCRLADSFGPWYVQFGTGKVVTSLSPFYDDPKCTSQFSITLTFYIFATSVSEASAICAELGLPINAIEVAPLVWNCA